MTTGRPLEGTWFDRTAQYLAWRRGDARTDSHFAQAERVVFSPLPCCAALEPADCRQRAAELMHRIIEDGRRERAGRPETAKWYILSAMRADKLLHEKLFDRVPALIVPRFVQVFSKAEVDMHFSLSQDLIELREFVRVVRESGTNMVTSLLSRGDY